MLDNPKTLPYEVQACKILAHLIRKVEKLHPDVRIWVGTLRISLSITSDVMVDVIPVYHKFPAAYADAYGMQATYLELTEVSVQVHPLAYSVVGNSKKDLDFAYSIYLILEGIKEEMGIPRINCYTSPSFIPSSSLVE